MVMGGGRVTVAENEEKTKDDTEEGENTRGNRKEVSSSVTWIEHVG